MTLSQIMKKVASYRAGLVEVTGGEPMEQAGTVSLLRALLRAGYRTMLETNGIQDVSRVPRQVVKILDVKGPSSGREKENRWSNLRHLTRQDELKFVIGDVRDYRFAKKVIKKHRLSKKNMLFSPLAGRLKPGQLASWVLRDRLPVRVQIQLHKILWRPDQRGR